MSAIKQRIRRGLMSGAFGLMGLVCFFVGASFLTHAAWLILSAAHGPVIAAQVIGGAYLLVGAIFFLIAARPGAEEDTRSAAAAQPQPSQQQAEPLAAVVQAFMTGLDAGHEYRQRRERN